MLKIPLNVAISISIIFDRLKLNAFFHLKIKTFQKQFKVPYFITTELSPLLEKSFWDFRTCEEYPDCLGCYEEEDCPLPSEDYNADLHTYCLEKCQIVESDPLPLCCFSRCSILEIFKELYVLQILNRLLKGEIKEHWLDEKSGLQIKILDLIFKPSIKELETEFEGTNNKKTFQLYKINPRDGTKRCIRNKDFGGDFKMDSKIS